ncbi:N-acetylmuramoyl-L-alanine amidase [Dorea phocaeensis]|uniref:N-acetylmuramoyl-L-alanine amidase n=1 Tax=Dorea phocaeensis TaxID=2040291 RepID=UPI000C77F229|nr:N-acetylmuramoyl-L-alanine amidase [Dorea phocaeensis]
MAHLFVIAGHGAGDPGAVGHGYTEAERVRALAGRLSALGGGNVTIGDTSRDWYRSGLINTLNIPKDWCVLELHMDSAGASARGGHVIIKQGYSPDSCDNALANFIGSFMPGRANLIVGRNNLANVNRAANRGINYRLLECGFITNAGDITTFNTKMDELARGILSAFGISSSPSGGWIKDSKGWWYKRADGSYPRSEWLHLDSWYWFDAEGYAVAGWQLIGGRWYYFNDDCRMLTGWRLIDNRWYYLSSNGDMLTGWQLIGGKWYYLTPEKQKDKDHPHGSMRSGFVEDGGRYTYYCIPKGDGSPEGAMITGWKQIDGDWYYLNEGKECQPLGSMMRNHWLGKYYLKDDGKMAKDETLEIGGKKYVFDKDGRVI